MNQTQQQQDDKSRQDALKKALATYGADVERWPLELREQASRMIDSDACAHARTDAEVIDDWLSLDTEPHAPQRLKENILHDFQRRQSTIELPDLMALFSRFRFAPAGALAGTAALGVVVGMMSVNGQVAIMPEEEALAYFDETLSELDTEATPWGAD